MKKKILLYGLSAIVLLSIFAIAMPVSAQVQMADDFGVSDASGDTGTYVEVPVTITNTANGPIDSMGFYLYYNENVLNLTNERITKEGLTSDWPFLIKSKEDVGVYWLGLTTDGATILPDGTPIPNGSTGSVVLLNFSVEGGPGTSSIMNFSEALMNAGDGFAPAKNGTFTVLGEADDPPYLVTYTISNRTISPDGDGVQDNTTIDVAFSESVDYAIKIEKDSSVIYDWTGTAQDPLSKTWEGTYESNGSIVPNGVYAVNVTMDDGVNPLVYNNTETITVSIPGEEPELTTIVVLPASITLNIGDPQPFTATAKDQDGNPMAGINVTWTSSNETVGTVSQGYAITDADGNAITTFTALAAGTATITAENETVSGTAEVTVTPSTVSITDFWIENTPESRGQEFRARVNLTTTADAAAGWYVIVVSGTGPESEGIAGVGTVSLTPSSGVDNMPVLVHIPALAKTGNYYLIASVHTLDEYPEGVITDMGPITATVQ